jgi:hypothetical protein
MSEQRQVTLEFLAEQQHRILSQIRILRDDVDVLAASVRPIDNSYDRLELRIEMVLMELREMRAELRAMQAQHDRTATRVRTPEEERQ